MADETTDQQADEPQTERRKPGPKPKAAEPERMRFRANATITAWELARVLELAGLTVPAEAMPRELRRHFETSDERVARIQREADAKAAKREQRKAG